MGKKILNESYVFSCSAAVTFPAPFINAKDTQSKGYDASGKKILTSGAKCSIKVPPLCRNNPNPTQPPVPPYLPCCLSGHSPWQNTNNTMTVDGKPTLTQDSKCTCSSKGGTISCKIPSYAVPTFKIETGASVGDIGDISAIVATDSTTKAASASTTTPPVEKAVVYPLSINNDLRGDGAFSVDNGKEADSNKAATEQTFAKVENQEVEEKEFMLCYYKRCKKTASCGYYNAELKVHNNSDELKSNYKAQFPHDQNAYENKEAEVNARLTDNGFTNAGHHLVSGNQCFLRKKDNKLRVGKLVRLAVFFGYDINNALNCILLPTSNIHSAKTENQELRASAFDIMSEMKAQWHVGGHSYPISYETKDHIKKYFNAYPQIGVSIAGDTLISNYADLVIEELEKLQARKYKQKRCQMVDKEMKAEEFSQQMNQISQNIKGKLDLFQENPKKSYPYYVSSVALSFAFDIPATLKLMVLTHTAKGIKGEIYRLKRLSKNDRTIQLTSVGCHLVEPTSSFVKFCSNVTFFLDMERQPLELDFYPSQGFKHSDLSVYPLSLSKHWDSSTSISTYLQENCHELLAEMSKYENAYQGASSVQSKRQKALKKGACDT